MRQFWRRGPQTESKRLERVKLRRERARKGLSVLPSMLTLGNLICGFGAIVRVAIIEFDGNGKITEAGQASLFYAGFLILLAMVFDALDGRVARLTKSTSDFGGQLDSLCDAVTFGVTPGLMVVLLNPIARFPSGSFWGQAAWVFGVAYACAAVLRLARFNVENTHDESAHDTFKGLPTPAAAGVIAALALFQNFLATTRGARLSFLSESLRHELASSIIFVMPLVAFGLAYLMISRHHYVHIVNVYVRGRTHFDHLNRLLFIGVIAALFIVSLPEFVAVLVFGGFAVSGPIHSLRRLRRERAAREASALALSAAPVAGAPAKEDAPVGEAGEGAFEDEDPNSEKAA